MRRFVCGVVVCVVAGVVWPIAGASADPMVLTQISAGQFHSCAVVIGGNVVCWGGNQYGQLGNNTTTSSSIPVAVTTTGVLAGKTITEVVAGEYHSCAVASGIAACWGYNSNGNLGNGSNADSPVPVAVTATGVLAGKTIAQVSVGAFHSCALTSDNTIACWGTNANGQLGNNTTTYAPAPVVVTTSGTPLAGKTITRIVSGDLHTCALATDNTIACWGANHLGQLGNNAFTDALVPVAVVNAGTPLAGKTITQIDVGLDHSCALASDSTIACWGDNTKGKLGNNSVLDSPVPVAVTIAGTPLVGKTITQVSAGYGHTCALAADSTIACWGDNTNGKLGNNSTNDSLVAVAVSIAGTPLAGETITHVSIASTHSCAMTSAGGAACWGANTNGELGNETNTNSLVPVAVSLSGTSLPSAPTIGTVTAGNAQATVNWIAPASEGGSAITGYVVTPFVGLTAQSPVTFNSTATTQAITGLTNGTSYAFKVAAQNAQGVGPQSALSTAVTLGVPDAPTIGTASAGDRQATLTWVAPASAGGSPITGYVVTPFRGVHAQFALEYDQTATTQTILGLENGAAYTFKVAAKNAVGTGPKSASSNVVTPVGPPGAPTIGIATAGNARATVQWTAGHNGGSPLTGYVVTPYIGATAKPPVTFNSLAVSQIVTGLTNGATYTFKVAAKNAIGTGPKSAVASNAVRPDGTPPTVSMVLPTRWNLWTNMAVKWSGSDAGVGGVMNYDLGRRAATWDGPLPASTTWLRATELTTKSFVGTYGDTYCMKVRGRDVVGNESAYSSERCGAIPLRADQMKYYSHWTRTPSVSAFAGFDMRTDRAGATVTRTNIVASRISLIATRGPHCGSIRVYWNGDLKKTVSLAARFSTHRQIVDLLTFPTPRSGNLKLVATTSVKTVIIEGLGISKVIT